MKNCIKGGDVFGVTVPVGRDWKTRTALRTNQIAGFVTVPPKKKNEYEYLSMDIICSSKLTVFTSWSR